MTKWENGSLQRATRNPLDETLLFNPPLSPDEDFSPSFSFLKRGEERGSGG
jgi:hypothetical protein